MGLQSQMSSVETTPETCAHNSCLAATTERTHGQSAGVVGKITGGADNVVESWGRFVRKILRFIQKE